MAGIRYFFDQAAYNLEIKECEDFLHASKAHFHPQISIGFVEKGSCVLEVYDKAYPISESTMLIIPPNAVHKCNPVNYKNWGFKMLYISEAWFESAFNKESKDISFLYKPIDKTFYSVFECIFDPAFIAAKDMGYESILIESISNLLDLGDKSFHRVHENRHSAPYMRGVKAYLDEHYLRPVMLEDISDRVHLSKYYIIRQFQQHYGLSPYQYLVNLRINEAKKLLGEQNEIIEVALQTGFYDQSHFTKCFKQYVGLTPMQYRKAVE